MIRQGRGTHFDPAMVDAFLEIAAEFKEIAQRYPTEHGTGHNCRSRGVFQSVARYPR